MPAFVNAMPYYPGRIVGPRFLIQCFVLAFGFFSQLNVIPTAFGVPFLRITDIIVITTLPIIYLVYVRIINSTLFLIHTTPIVMTLFIALLLSYNRADGEHYSSIFTFLYILYFLPFTFALLKEDCLELFCWGVLLGFGATVMCLLFDLYSPSTLSRFGLALEFDYQAVADAAATGDVNASLIRFEKAGGLWSQGNEAGPVFALAAAAAAYLAEKRRSFLIFASFFLLYIISFSATLNRSGMGTVLLVSILSYTHSLSNKKLKLTALYAALGAFLLSIILPLGLFGLIEGAVAKRFVEDDNAASNVFDRLESLGYGVQVAMNSPFGIGLSARVAEMNALGHFGSPHNGFISTAFTAGVLISIFVLGSVAYLIFRRRKIRFFLYVAVTLTCGYLFEELDVNPAFMCWAGLLIGYTALDLDFRLVRGPSILRRTLNHSPDEYPQRGYVSVAQS